MTAIRTYAQAGGLLVRTLDLPGARRVAHPPANVEEGTLGDWPATIARPRSRPPWPAVLFANGATPDGRTHPGVRRLSIALARSGYLVFIPDLPGIADGELTPRTLASAVECVATAAESNEVLAGRIGLLGVSVGGTLALLTAGAAQVAARVSVVACVAPFTDLEKVMMLATTATYPGPKGPEPYSVPPSLPVGLARSLVALLATSPDASILGQIVGELDPKSPDPLGPLRASAPLSGAPETVRELLSNRDPSRFPALYAALPEDVRRVAVSLSPLRSSAGLVAPVEIATAPRDTYFPVAESFALAGEVPDARVTVTSALSHAVPTISLTNLAGIARLYGFFARSLAAAR